MLYQAIVEHLETFLASLDNDPEAKSLPAYVQREFYNYLQCGILAHGFLRLGCDTCQQEVLLAFRDVVGHSSLTATITLSVIEGGFVDRTDQGLKPRFVTVEPPSDADVAKGVQNSGRRVIRKLRRLGCLEAEIDAAVATGYDPLLDNKPELARIMAASAKQRIAFGERAGEKIRRIGSGFGYEGERPEFTGPRCASVNGCSLHANTAMPAHRRDQLERLIRYTARGAVSLERLEEDSKWGCGSFAAITRESVMTRILRRLKLASVSPPSLCPLSPGGIGVRRSSCQRGLRGDVRATAVFVAPF